MLTISLHGIRIFAKRGLYPEEKINGNDFEVDVDVCVNAADTKDLPFFDYAIIYQIVEEAFKKEGELLETFATLIHTAVKEKFSEADKVRVAVRKLHPPLGADVRYSQVMIEH